MKLYAGKPRDDRGEYQAPVEIPRTPDPVDGRIGAPAPKPAKRPKGESA